MEDLEKEIKNFARTNLDYYGLPNWQFSFCKSKTYSGLCNYKKQTIYYSKYYIHIDFKDVQQTILHEIAHALTPGDCHGRKWALACDYLGIPAKIYEHHPRPPGNFIANCTCGYSYSRYNRVSKDYVYHCPDCKSPIYFERILNVK